MNKKLLIVLSSMALVAGFWACGEGSVEVIEEQSDDEMIQALLSTGNMNFGATDIKKAKDACMNDFECFNEMTKAQGAAIVESSSEEAISSATPLSSPKLPRHPSPRLPKTNRLPASVTAARQPQQSN